MTSKNSFWANCKENHKRRIWVWIVSVLGQLAVYVGRLMVYLTRQRIWYERGDYPTFDDIREVMCRATSDALGFHDIFLVTLIGLAVIIGVQGFSYLDDRRKVDMYHSVPVDKNRRFAAVYLNGLVIYLTSTIVSLLVGLLVAVLQGAVDGTALAVIVLAFVWNLLFFMVIYHTVILAVMLTGNRLISLCMAGVLMLYEIILNELNYAMKYEFFHTVSTYFVDCPPRMSAVYDYYSTTYDVKGMAWNESVGALARQVLPYCGKWLILAVAFLVLSWLCYRKRPSEAAGRAIAFAKTGSVFKVLIVIPACIGLGMIIYDASYGSMFLTMASMVLGGVIACAAVEAVYDFDIRSLLKHPISSGVAIVGIVFVFLIYNNDLFGYDKYVPQESSVDSIALYIGNTDGDFWEEDFSYLDVSDYYMEHMFITDVEPVLTLASKWQQEYKRLEEIENSGNIEDINAILNTTDYREVRVLYRLKSGQAVGRRFSVDFINPANKKLLNRIVGTEEYKAGAYQIMTDSDSFAQVQAMDYSNGTAVVGLLPEDAQRLRDAYVKDMEQFDFSLATEERPCGRVNLVLPKHRIVYLYVYESFENTIAYLKEQGAYYPVQLNPEDIADITIKNYHNELEKENLNSLADFNIAMGASPSAVAYGASLERTVTVTFDDEEDFAQIVPAIYPSYFTAVWHNDGLDMDENYDIRITFKRDTSYPYDKSDRVFYYKFYAGQVPEFVVEATAYHADTE